MSLYWTFMILCSYDRLSNNLHCILEGLDRVREVIDYLVLRGKPIIHFIFQLFSQFLELVHGIFLEFFNVFMLHLQLPIGVISELAQSQALISPLIINFLSKFVFFIIECLKDVLLPISTCLTLLVKLWLQVGEVILGSVDELVGFCHPILNFLSNSVLETS